ncbi:hypothetical protein O9G_005671 [Rozella allomycis CSF55]|uniref:Uncharacterized protein n=1 Tax=Rozella allomycis (strain CSF55) TaxID=988480 RepID=A0A075B1H3_ROZAC|nr:hypothetical protein O9G_005671 [Rozella allomycis CSF55]|eukprot:EPZ34628.1 hypothetical protein O9G_005671 [Rozella allomycis CSF55]
MNFHELVLNLSLPFFETAELLVVCKLSKDIYRKCQQLLYTEFIGPKRLELLSGAIPNANIIKSLEVDFGDWLNRCYPLQSVEFAERLTNLQTLYIQAETRSDIDNLIEFILAIPNPEKLKTLHLALYGDCGHEDMVFFVDRNGKYFNKGSIKSNEDEGELDNEDDYDYENDGGNVSLLSYLKRFSNVEEFSAPWIYEQEDWEVLGSFTGLKKLFLMAGKNGSELCYLKTLTSLTHIRLYCFTPRHSLDFVEELNAPLEFVEIILEENEAYYCGFGKDNSKTYKALSEKYPNARILCDKTYTNWHDIADDLLLILKRPFNSD